MTNCNQLDLLNQHLPFTRNVVKYLQVNAVFTWKTSKLGRTLQRQTQNGPPKKKLKVSIWLSLKDGCQLKEVNTETATL
jgi:hypothetical protein